jgi:hypothetical protein
MTKLVDKKADKTLPYTLTQARRNLVAKAVAEAWEAKGSNTPRMPSVKVYHNRRFHG